MSRRRFLSIIGFVVFLCFALIDLLTFVQGAPDMWAFWRDIKSDSFNFLFFALRLMESAVLLSLLLSATLLLLCSRWAIVVAVAQLPVRILCGYSVLPFFAVAQLLGRTDLPSMFFLIAMVFDLVRIAATGVILRSMKQEGQTQLGASLSFRRGLAAGASVLLLVIALSSVLHRRPPLCLYDSSSKTVESILEDVDAQLFFNGNQLGGRVTSAIAVTWQGDERPRSAMVDTLGLVHFDTDGMQSAISWKPGCGPWNLEHLMAFELGLFSGPWSERLGSPAWTDKAIVPMAGGYRLGFVPTDSLGGPADFNTPVVRSFQVWVDSTGVPRQGFCQLDMKLFPARARLWFEFDDCRGSLRIRRIVNQIDMASVRITPKLELRYRERDGLVYLEGADFFVPLEQLSSFLGQAFGGEQVTRLRFVNQEFELPAKP